MDEFIKISACLLLAYWLFSGILLEVAGGTPEVAGGTPVASEPSVSSIHLLLFPEYNAPVSLNASAPCQERVHEQDLASEEKYVTLFSDAFTYFCTL